MRGEALAVIGLALCSLSCGPAAAQFQGGAPPYYTERPPDGPPQYGPRPSRPVPNDRVDYRPGGPPPNGPGGYRPDDRGPPPDERGGFRGDDRGPPPDRRGGYRMDDRGPPPDERGGPRRDDRGPPPDERGYRSGERGPDGPPDERRPRTSSRQPDSGPPQSDAYRRFWDDGRAPAKRPSASSSAPWPRVTVPGQKQPPQQAEQQPAPRAPAQRDAAASGKITIPVAEYRALREQAAELQRLLGERRGSREDQRGPVTVDIDRPDRYRTYR